MTSPPRSASFMRGAWRVFELSLGEMLWSRRTIFMALVLAAPVILALVSRIVQAMGVAPLKVNGVRVGGAGIFGMMIWVLFIRFTIPVLGVFYGTSLIADEIEDKTEEEIKAKLPEAYHEFFDVFSKKNADKFPASTKYDHAINLKESYDPRRMKPYILSPDQEKEVKDFIKENLKLGRIRPSRSPM